MDSSSSSYVYFHASIRHFLLADFAPTNFRTFETTDPPLDDISQTNTYDDGGGPYQVVDAWNGVKRTPLAVVMSVFTLL